MGGLGWGGGGWAGGYSIGSVMVLGDNQPNCCLKESDRFDLPSDFTGSRNDHTDPGDWIRRFEITTDHSFDQNQGWRYQPTGLYYQGFLWFDNDRQ